MKLGAWLTMVLALAMTACTVPDDDNPYDPSKTPGGDSWNHDTNVACNTTEDCSEGEVCEDGVCQMARCGETYESRAPMGPNKYFGTDGEYAIISDKSYIDAFEPQGGSYINSWDLGGDEVVDVAGGNLSGERPQTVAVAVEYSSKVLLNGGPHESIDLGIWAVAIDAGDVDADGVDELVAISDTGEIALCQVDEGSCIQAGFDGVTGKDVAVADVDADGFAEPIFLLDYEGESEIIVWNPNADETGEEQSYGWKFSFPVVAMDAGLISGGQAAEIATLEDGGWWGWTDDKVHLFSPVAEEFLLSQQVDGHTEDVAVGDRNSDDQEEIAILREAKKISLYGMSGEGTLSELSITDITVGNDPQRLSMVDWDGDSASGRLVSGPELIAGKAVPIAALMFPPYPHKLAAGALSANITLGDVESTEESFSDTLSLSVGMGFAFGGEAAGFKAKVGGHFKKTFEKTKTVSSKLEIGARYWILAQPGLHGTSYAPVIMSCGCYHRYRYETVDPGNHIGGTGQTLDVLVPVGGQTQLWSSKRYNAMAEATGTLPIIEIPVRVGDVSSYTSEIDTMSGEPVKDEDMLFPFAPVYTISDVGFVNFWLVAGESETNATAETTELGVNASFGAFGAEINTEFTVGHTQGYSLRTGKSQLFAGGLPPVPDDPGTPEDEYELHRYSLTPYVYREHYIDAAGEESGFYVMNYAVSE